MRLHLTANFTGMAEKQTILSRDPLTYAISADGMDIMASTDHTATLIGQSISGQHPLAAAFVVAINANDVRQCMATSGTAGGISSSFFIQGPLTHRLCIAILSSNMELLGLTMGADSA